MRRSIVLADLSQRLLVLHVPYEPSPVANACGVKTDMDFTALNLFYVAEGVSREEITTACRAFAAQNTAALLAGWAEEQVPDPRVSRSEAEGDRLAVFSCIEGLKEKRDTRPLSGGIVHTETFYFRLQEVVA